MRDFIDYLQEAFITSSGGNTYDNSYSHLDLTARSLLSFYTPSGARITLSSFVRPKFGTSYSIGIKNGWISYLYSSLPLPPTYPDTPNDVLPPLSSPDQPALPDLLRSYRPLSTQGTRHAVGHSLVYGRMYLPESRLEALLASRVTREVNLTLRAVSSQEDLRHGATVLGLAAWDDPAGRFGIETLASTDGGVLGLRGLWNASNPPSEESHADQNPTSLQSSSSSSSTSTTAPSTTTTNTILADPSNTDKERINGRFSAGGEIYYGLLNKSGGISLGGRFQTLPTHHGTPLTATLTFNLLGHIRATYSVIAGDCTLASCFGFNLYSYESEWAVGIELWNRRRRSRADADADAETGTEEVERTEGTEEGVQGLGSTEHKRAALGDSTLAGESEGPENSGSSITPTSSPPSKTWVRKERSFQAKLEWRSDDDNDNDDDDDDNNDAAKAEPAFAEGGQDRATEDDFPAGVLKARCDQHMRIGLLYEGRYKSLLFSLGTDVDFRKLDAPFRTVGLAVQYSS